MKKIYRCTNCGNEMPEYIVEHCCDGELCGCMGEPINSLVCNQRCWDELIEKMKEN